jgi:hypothetical protein
MKYVSILCLWFVCNGAFAQDNHKANQKMNHALYGTWTNESHWLHLSDDKDFWIELNHSCAIEFPINIINANSFEILWDLMIDCTFDISSILKDFGLKSVPVKGQPFAKYELVDGKIVATYYYQEWVATYTEKEIEFLFKK